MKDSVDALLDGYDQTISVTDLAKVLGVTRQTLYGWLQSGHVPGHRLPNGGWLIITEDVKAMLRAGSNRPARTTAEPEADARGD